ALLRCFHPAWRRRRSLRRNRTFFLSSSLFYRDGLSRSLLRNRFNSSRRRSSLLGRARSRLRRRMDGEYAAFPVQPLRDPIAPRDFIRPVDDATTKRGDACRGFLGIVDFDVREPERRPGHMRRLVERTAEGLAVPSEQPVRPHLRTHVHGAYF